MTEDKILNEYITNIKTGKYTLAVKTTERCRAEHDSGKMKDMPGTFLDAIVSVESISGKLDFSEELAVQHKVVLWEEKEITNEPKGYAKQYHKNLVEKVKKSPDDYLKYVRGVTMALM